MPLLVQKLLNLPGHTCSPRLIVGFVWLNHQLSVYCFVNHSLSLFSCFFVLSVLLWFTSSDYPFGIFKRFLLMTAVFNRMTDFWLGGNVTVGFAITPLHRNRVFLTVENNKMHQIYLALYFNKTMQNHTSIGHQQLFASNITAMSWLCPWSSIWN